MTCNHILVATPANCYKGVVSTVSLVRSPSLFGDGFNDPIKQESHPQQCVWMAMYNKLKMALQAFSMTFLIFQTAATGTWIVASNFLTSPWIIIH